MVAGTGGGSADYADTFATAHPAGPGQLGPGGSGDYAETFATAKQAPATSAPLGAPESFATAKASPAVYKTIVCTVLQALLAAHPSVAARHAATPRPLRSTPGLYPTL